LLGNLPAINDHHIGGVPDGGQPMCDHYHRSALQSMQHDATEFMVSWCLTTDVRSLPPFGPSVHATRRDRVYIVSWRLTTDVRSLPPFGPSVHAARRNRFHASVLCRNVR
jgi:hypothetical protein